MQVLIYANQIAGHASTAMSADNLPAGFTLVDAPDLPLDALYWDGSSIKEKPPRPGDRAYWDSLQNAWIDPPAPALPPSWDLLVAHLRGSVVWSKVYAAAQAKNRTSVAFVVLMMALTTTRDLSDLRFSLRELLHNSPGVFSQEDLDYIRDGLIAANFDPTTIPGLYPEETPEVPEGTPEVPEGTP